MDLLDSDDSADEVVLRVSSLTRDWIVDSEASKHMTPVKNGLRNLCSIKGHVVIGNNSTV